VPLRGLVRREVSVPGVEMVVGDMLEPASLELAVAGIDVVVHTAVDESGDVALGRRVNEGGTRALAEAALAAGCRRFVHISTCAVYALEGIDVVTEETPLWPEERIAELTYGVTKALGERALADVAARGLGVVILRPPNVLGAHERCIFCETLATGVRDGKIGYALEGASTWPYVHVENLIDAVEAAVDVDAPPGRAYTVVDGHTTWRAFLEDYAGWYGVEVARRDVRGVYDHFRGRFATERARSELGYHPRRSYADAMAETWAFLRARGLVPEARAGGSDRREVP
jgi:nucleoside-diphosphate-sugar epimerase